MSIEVDLLVLVLCAAAICCHAFMLASCGLLQFVGEQSDQNGRYGLFLFQLPDDGDECSELRFVDRVTGRYGADGPTWEPRRDAHLRAAQIGSCFAVGCGFVLFTLIIFRQFLFPLLPCSEFVMDVCCLAIQVGLAMVYLLWQSEGCHYFECQIGTGSWFLIVSQVLWAIAACFTKCMRPNAFQRNKMAEEERTRAGSRVRFKNDNAAPTRRASLMERIIQEDRAKRIFMELIPFGVGVLLMVLMIFLAFRARSEAD